MTKPASQCYGLDDRGSIPSGWRKFSLRNHVEICSGVNPDTYLMCRGTLSLGVKLPEHEVDT